LQSAPGSLCRTVKGERVHEDAGDQDDPRLGLVVLLAALLPAYPSELRALSSDPVIAKHPRPQLQL
jgi:hypothetical protein